MLLENYPVVLRHAVSGPEFLEILFAVYDSGPFCRCLRQAVECTVNAGLNCLAQLCMPCKGGHANFLTGLVRHLKELMQILLPDWPTLLENSRQFSDRPGPPCNRAHANAPPSLAR
jgi:hypothetical protein